MATDKVVPVLDELFEILRTQVGTVRGELWTGALRARTRKDLLAVIDRAFAQLGVTLQGFDSIKPRVVPAEKETGK